ncbi:MAG: glycosyltransferase [Chloroflexi bacterium]|nr:glycosyltransferase [Chloroflexota bacterium]
MERTCINAENTVFVLLSFEGPDLYSLAGGLGVRITNLASTLANSGFETHLFFVGDPARKGHEISCGGKLHYHRWCQWISRYHPNGVYQGEEGKLNDFKGSIPGFVVNDIVKPAEKNGKLVVVLGEEWHTTEAMCNLSELLYDMDLRDRVVMFWNANNTFGFNRIDWRRLADNTTITTVSRYMKQIMQRMGLSPFAIPNGIPSALLNVVDTNAATRLRKSLNADLVLAKVARWDPDKRWHMAVESVARLKSKGIRTRFLARGGMEPHGEEVKHNARSLGLTIREVRAPGNDLKSCMGALASAGEADILDIKFHCSPELLRLIYYASDAVLANSGHEPFGLVGLETMAARGIAFTGGTGEDYAIHLHNSVVLETSDPREIETYVLYFAGHNEIKESIRREARRSAAWFTWEQVVRGLIDKLEYQARLQEVLEVPRLSPVWDSTLTVVQNMEMSYKRG